MSNANAAIQILVHEDQPIRKTVRRLRWFKLSFHNEVDRISEETGVAFEIDEKRLAAAFVEWLRAFDAQKPTNPASRRSYVGFAAGLMLRTLITHKPVSVAAKPEGADDTNPAYFWPEGYVYVAYCLNVRSAVLDQDFHEEQKIAPELSKIQTWWSFKENIKEDSSLSIAFLDLFAGDKPQWTLPGFFRDEDVTAIASKFYEPRKLPSAP